MNEGRFDSEDLISQALALLAVDHQRPEPSVATPPRRSANGYEEAAAVLGWFAPGHLRPAKPAPPDDLDRLAAAAITVLDDQGAARLSIGSSHRVDVLGHLLADGGFERAISANPAAEGDVLGRLIRGFATGSAVEVDQIPLAELYSVALVCDWLREAGLTGLPSARSLQDRIDRLELLESFTLLAGPDFVGRKAELARLRTFVTDEPDNPRRRGPGSSSGKGLDFRMLAVYGPAGIGKSTLIAKLILELAGPDRPSAPDVLFAYLDFDRPAMDATTDAFPLLAELLTQLAVQVPEAKAASRNIRRAWSWTVERPPAEKVDATRQAVDEVATLLTSLGLKGRRFVLVLDTFEVVQRRSSEEVATILRLVDLLVAHEDLQDLRVVLAGRAAIARHYADAMEVARLDPESARQLLARHGVTDRKVAERIVRRYDGDPIALKLAAASPETHQGLTNALSRAGEWFRQLDEAVIQRRLYERVLGHIEDPEVAKLARSGLVLRRLTPGIVLDVLAGPCGLHVKTYAQAQRVFEELERETSLVEPEADGALLHRPELRRLMLPLLEADRPELAQTLHLAAVAYYAERPPEPRERAEEIYHRLKSGEETDSVAARWLAGVEPFLQSALVELDGSRRAFLASSSRVTVDPQATIEAHTVDYERITARRVRAMLNDDRPRDALTALSRRQDVSELSPLVPLRAEANFALGQVDQALDLLGDAADAGLDAEGVGGREQALALSRLQAELVVSAGAWRHAPAVGARLQTLEGVVSAPLLGLACTALAAVMTERTDPAGSAALRRRAQDVFDTLADEALVTDPSLVRVVGSLHVAPVDVDDVRRVSRAVRLAGLPRQMQGPVRIVAAEIAALDATASGGHGEAPGMLARRYDLCQGSSLTATWSAFLIGADDLDTRSAVCGVLDLPGPVPDGVVVALARLLGNDPALRRPSGPYVGGEPDVIQQVALSSDHREALVEALRDTFDPESLRWFLRLRLHLSLDALVPAAVGDFRGSIGQLVATLEQRGVLLELVAHCREVAPGDRRFFDVAHAVGLLTPVSSGTGDAGRELLRVSDLRSGAWWRALGRLEGQVCRVRAGEGTGGAGFLVGADLLLTAAAVVDGVTASSIHCQFDAKHSRDGRVVTPGVWYDVVEVVTTATAVAGDGTGRWTLLRVGGSPGVQPIGGDSVESMTGTLRGWVDLASARDPGDSQEVLLLGPADRGSLVLTAGRSSTSAGRYVQHDTAVSRWSVGAPVLSRDLTPVGVHVGPVLDHQVPEAGVGVTLRAVMHDLAHQHLDHLVQVPLP